MPPWPLTASCQKRVYHRVLEMRDGLDWQPHYVAEIKQEEKVIIMRQWEISARRQGAPGELTRMALRPVLNQWCQRKFGCVDFHLTQILSGHGCFGHYLHRMQKRWSPMCQQCASRDDTCEHTLIFCSEWFIERRRLVSALDIDSDLLNLMNIIKEIVVSEDKWTAFSVFVHTIMSGKEEDERSLQAALPSPTSD
ncbi:uncharacterized protein LOC114944915 [Nylanderia fulva]|uniref:uncharacterized protein LOC114927890 n=1 Tax=Nylanderia fulva TaxID=613905 RepID=UPI0010FAD4A7|nr:uncharacterized protein LOC114927890 [Nylanderia fulva]XP_029156956.1 uncharacterized protein LOC114929550 [Nylanderia fulva]XP_029170126.1 uncharacterized protein LOC114939854 [Nylanderia fulva]XP_029176066.1 uncharacterized protein LOC114944337 [Nylanderia fulva]XP_029176803.1 uncharacterized protein LOC114944915 [Nylanderia fulva]